MAASVIWATWAPAGDGRDFVDASMLISVESMSIARMRQSASARPAGTKAASTPCVSAQCRTWARVSPSCCHVEQAGRGGADARHALGLGQRRQLFGVFGRQGGETG